MINYNTKNESFIRVHEILKANGVENNNFFLHLENEALKDVDVFNPPDRETALAIINECNVNPYFFMREVFVMPSEDGTMQSFMLDIASLSSLFLTNQGFSIYREQPRQTGKTTGAGGELSCNWNVRCRNADIAIVNFDDTAAKENLQRVVDYSSYLPSYLQIYKLNPTVNSDNSVDIDDGEEIGKTVKVATNKIFNNRLVAKTVGTTPAMANKVGKGGTFSIEFFDEVAVYPNLELVLGAAAPAFKTASDNARKGGFPTYMYLTSTPPDMSSVQGEFLYKMVKTQALKFEPYMFDLSTKELASLLRNKAKNNYFYITYSYKELGFSDDWALEHYRNLNSQWLFERDILLRWKKNLKDSPFNMLDLEKIESMVYEKKNYIAIPMKFEARDFSEFGSDNLSIKSKLATLEDIVLECKIFEVEGYTISELLNKYKFDRISLACDVSAGYGDNRDSSTICGSDVETGETIFTFKSNRLDPILFALVIYYTIKKYFPNALLTIERNSYGEAVISELVYTSVERNLYYTTKTSDVLNVSTKMVKRGDLLYGVYNVQKIRHILFGVICAKMVRENKRIIKSYEIYEEISTLILKDERIDHKPGCHDDLLIAKLLSLYPLLFDNNIEAFFKIPKLILMSDDTFDLIKAGIISSGTNDRKKEVYEVQMDKLKDNKSLLTLNDIKDLIDMDVDGSNIKAIQNRFGPNSNKKDYGIAYRSHKDNKKNNDPYR